MTKGLSAVFLWRVATWLYAGGVAISAAQQLYVISGVAVQQGTKRPVKHATVIIAKNDHPEEQATVVTGADGRFTFTDVPLGKYTLAAESQGATTRYRQNENYSTGIAVGPSLPSQDIVFPLPGPTSLTVGLSDEEGEPVQGAQILLCQRSVDSGWPRVSLAGQGISDDEGKYRFSRLVPGTYFVAAGGRPWYAQSLMGSQLPESQAAAKDLDVAFATTYYPSTSNPTEAASIPIAAGGAATVQINLRAVPALKISLGELGAISPGQPSNIGSSIETVGPGGIRLPVNASVFGDATGSEIRGLAPGNYLVSLSTYGPQQPTNLGTAFLRLDSDTQLNAASFVKTKIDGRLVIEAAGQITPGMQLWLAQIDTSQAVLCPVETNGNFYCGRNGPSGGGTPAGRYEFGLANSDSLYLKSISASGAMFADGLLNLSEGASVHLKILAAKGQTKLNGLALRDGKPYPGAMILLVPQTPDGGPGFPRDQSDSDGTFTLQDVHPGRGLLLAVDDGRDLEYHNPQALQPYLSRAKLVEVPLVSGKPLQVDVQKRIR